MVSALAQPCCALPSPTASALCPLPGLCAAAAMSSRPPSSSLLLSVRGRVGAWARECVQVVGAPPSPAHPTKRHQTWHGDCVASHVCSSRYGGLPCIRPSPLYPRTVHRPARLTHPSGQPGAGALDQSGRNIIASRDSREAIPAACLSPLLLHLPHPSSPCCTLLLAAPCSTWPSRLHSHLLRPAPCTLHPPCNPTPPFESRPHVPPVDTTQDPGMHLRYRYGLQHGTAVQHAQYGDSVWTWALGRGQSLAEPAPHR